LTRRDTNVASEFYVLSVLYRLLEARERAFAPIRRIGVQAGASSPGERRAGS